MVKRISDNQREKAWKLYTGGESISDISRIVRIPYSSAWFLTEGRRRGFSSFSKYHNYLAVKSGYADRMAYLNELAKKNRYADYSDYKLSRIKLRGHVNSGVYQKSLAVSKGFRNVTEYRNFTASKKEKIKLNIALSLLIKSRLKELCRTQGWLAEKLGVVDSIVSYYSRGQMIPREERLQKIFEILEVNGCARDLEGLVE